MIGAKKEGSLTQACKQMSSDLKETVREIAVACVGAEKLSQRTVEKKMDQKRG